MSDLGQIYNKLEEVDEKVDKLLTWQAVHDTKHEVVDRDINEVREVLFENPGLKSKVERLWNGRKDSFRWRDLWMYVLRVLIIAGILGVIGWLLGLYRSVNLGM